MCKNGGKCLTTPFGLFLKWYIGLLQAILTRFSLQDGVIAGSGKNQKTLYQRNVTNKGLLDSVIEIHKAKLTQSQVIRIQFCKLELALDNEARNNALKNVNEFYVLDLLRDKTRLTFKKIFSLSYPEYTTGISITDEPASQTIAELPGDAASKDQDSSSGK